MVRRWYGDGIRLAGGGRGNWTGKGDRSGQATFGLSLCGFATAQIAGMGASIDEGITLPMIFDFKGLESDSKILLIK